MTFGNNGWSQINKHASKKLDEVVKKIEASTMEEGIISFLDWGNKSDWKSFLQDTLLPLAENSGCLRALDIRSCKEPAKCYSLVIFQEIKLCQHCMISQFGFVFF